MPIRRAHARFRLGDRLVTLYPGDQIGRLRSAALSLDDARISEAHALISLRGTELKLLSLRGLFAISGTPRREALLTPGLRIELATDLVLEVVDVVLPDRVLALEGDGLPRHALAGVNALTLEPKPNLHPRYRGTAEALVWPHGETWRLRHGGGERTVDVGDSFRVGDRTFRFVEMPLSTGTPQPTRRDGGVHAPLRLIAQYDTVQIHRRDHPVLLLSGIGARILSELVTLDGPASWHVIASQIWRDDDVRYSLRARWDTALLRLRKKLDAAHLRADLIRADGTGCYELVLLGHDTVEDRT